MSAPPRVVCVVGPTASGKSALGLALAERLGGEIVSADSRQVYRQLAIGTAKPTAAERARVPHHLLDRVDPDETFDAARFRREADGAIRAIVARRRLPIVVGGTGLYVRVLVRGLCPAPPRAPALRAALERVVAGAGAPTLHRELTAADPATAARLSPHDAVRIVRALEVVRTSGVPLSEWQRRHRFVERPYTTHLVGLAWSVPELDARIAARVGAMLEAGLLDEVRALRDAGFGATTPGLRAVGYREMLACVEGRLSLADAIAATVRATRRFARRQRTWFRREPDVIWYHPERDATALRADVEAFAAGAPAAGAAR